MNAKSNKKAVKVKIMTTKDKENLRKLNDSNIIDNRGYNRIINAADEGWLEIEISFTRLRKLDLNVRKFAKRIWAKRGPELIKSGLYRVPDFYKKKLKKNK